MPGFMKMGTIQGEATDKGHDQWIIIQALSAPIRRSVSQGAKDSQRSRGETRLGDVSVVRELDKSSTKIQQACANGTFFDEVEVHLCTTVGDKQEPFLKYKLKNVIITSYSVHVAASGDPLPTESLTMAYTEVEWTYVVIDPQTGKPSGHVPASYNPGKGSTK